MSYFGHYPSIELQALAFAEQTKTRRKEEQTIDTEWNGFAVELVYVPDFQTEGRQIGTTLIITDVAIPPKYQCKKWLLRYFQFCGLLAEDALGVFTTQDWMEDILSGQRPAFELIGTRMWLWEKHSKGRSMLNTTD